jgi:SAM-dependent methyltransferase
LFNYLGDLTGRTVLDLGCGYHPTPIFFALAGARRVYACDVSQRAVAHILKLAEQYGVSDRVVAIVSAGERLPIPNESIDLVHGEAVLHHLDISLAGTEIRRVLRRGGRAAFKDPFGHNPLLEFARDYLPYRWKAAAKGTDRPLRVHDIKRFGQRFGRYQYRAFGLLSMLVVATIGRDDSKVLRLAHATDELVLKAFPFVQRLCRFVVTCAEKPMHSAPN